MEENLKAALGAMQKRIKWCSAARRALNAICHDLQGETVDASKAGRLEDFQTYDVLREMAVFSVTLLRLENAARRSARFLEDRLEGSCMT